VASLLHLSLAEAGGELDRAGEGGRGRDNIRAVDQVLLTEDLELGHGSLELSLHAALVVDHRLPEAGSARVLGDGEIGLETHLTGNGGQDLTSEAERLVGVGELGALEEDLEEDLGVEGTDGGVEGGSGDRGVNNIGGSDGVGGQESDGLLGREAGIGEAGQDLGDAVGGLRDSQVGSGRLGGGAAEVELQLGSTRAVSSANGSSEMDEVSRAQLGLGEDWELSGDNVVDTSVRVEGKLGAVEDKDRAVSSSSLAAAEREANSVVEGKTESRVSFFTALSTVEELILEKIDNGEESAASGIGGGVA